jgi:hypothetical protein
MNPEGKGKNDRPSNRGVANRDHECDGRLTSVTGFARAALPK